VVSSQGSDTKVIEWKPDVPNCDADCIGYYMFLLLFHLSWFFFRGQWCRKSTKQSKEEDLVPESVIQYFVPDDSRSTRMFLPSHVQEILNKYSFYLFSL
jgi:hypothetical protein